jgi:adenylate cyclase
MLSLVATQATFVGGLEDWMFDSCFFWRGARATATRVVVVGLDDVSIDMLEKPLMYTSPELATVVDYLAKQHVAAIGLDLMVPERLAALKALQRGGEGDSTTLGTAISHAGNVVLPQWLGPAGETPLLPLPQWRLKALGRPEPADLGFVTLTEDLDHTIRRQRLWHDEPQSLQFALALLMKANPARVQMTPEGPRIDGQVVPTGHDAALRINYVGPPGSLPFLSFRDVLAGARGEREPGTSLAGSIVIIGVTARNQQDYHATPFSNDLFGYISNRRIDRMSGTELQANVLAALSDRAWITAPPPVMTLFLLLVAGSALGAAYAHLNLTQGAVLALGHHFGWRGLCLFAFQYANLCLPLLPMLALGALAYVATFAIRWNRLRTMFGVFKSEAIARAIEGSPLGIDVRGEDYFLTVLFSDIRDFTSYSERHSPQQVVALLNAYFSAIVPIIDRHGGTLNQYMGDGIMVLFGAPRRCADHAARAVRAAKEMVARVHELRKTWEELDNPGLRIGVGIHTGRVVMGTVGSPHRLDYTAIGDTVNVASRIESENKRWGTEVLLSEETYRELPSMDRHELGSAAETILATVKGRDQQIRLYHLPFPSRPS